MRVLSGLPALLAALACGGGGTPLFGQVVGAPISYSPIHDPGWSLHAETAHGYGGLAGFHYWGARSTWAPGFNGTLRFTGIAGIALQREAPDYATLGVALAWQPWRRRLLLADVQVGAGYGRKHLAPAREFSEVNLPAGVAFGLNALLPFETLANVQLWVAPRVQLRATRERGGATGTEWNVGPGATVGLELLLPSGLGLQAAFDWLSIEHPLTGRRKAEFTLGGGIVFRRVPEH